MNIIRDLEEKLCEYDRQTLYLMDEVKKRERARVPLRNNVRAEQEKIAEELLTVFHDWQSVPIYIVCHKGHKATYTKYFSSTEDMRVWESVSENFVVRRFDKSDWITRISQGQSIYGIIETAMSK